MKHLFLRAICLLLALCALLPAALAEEEGFLTDLPGFSDGALFVRDGRLHAAIVGEGRVYRQTDGGWMPLGGFLSDAMAMDASDGAVWALGQWNDASDDRAGFRIERMSFQPDGTLGEAEICCDIAWDIRAEEWPMFYGFAVVGGAAYVLVADAADFMTHVLYRVDLTSGVGAKMLSSRMSGLVHYKDGLLLSRRFSLEDWVNDRQPEIVTINPATGAVEAIGLMTGSADGALAYDPEGDSIYFSNSSNVYRAAGGAPEIVGYMIPSGMEHERCAAAVFQSQYHVVEGSLITASIDPALLPERTLRIAHEYDLENVIQEFAALHPEIAVQYADGLPRQPEELVLHMQSSAAADVYSYSVDSNFATLRDKKYMIDLSDSEQLTAVMNRMDRRLIAPLYADGRLIAVPYHLDLYTDGYRPGAFEKAGVPLETVPTSMEELLEFIVTWHDEYLEDNEGMQFYEYSVDLRNELFMKIVILQGLRCQEAGETPSLNAPEVRALLTRLEEIAPIIAEVAPPVSNQTFSGDTADSALFSSDAQPLPHLWIWEEAPQTMPLSLLNDTAPLLTASMQALAINPYSANADIALELLEYIAQHLSEETQIALMPDRNEPVSLMDEEDLEEQRERIAQLTQQLECAPEEDKVEAQWQLQMARESLEFMEQHRWAISEEDLAYYRERIEPYMIYPMSVIFGAAAEQINGLCVRYMDGQISLEEFIREYDRVVWMIENE